MKKENPEPIEKTSITIEHASGVRPQIIFPKYRAKIKDFVYIMQNEENALKSMATNRRITAEAYRVFLIMLCHCDYQNIVCITQEEIARELSTDDYSMKQPNVSRAIKVLSEENIIKHKKMVLNFSSIEKKLSQNTYILNPFIVGKGRVSKLKHLKRDWIVSQAKSVNKNPP